MTLKRTVRKALGKIPGFDAWRLKCRRSEFQAQMRQAGGVKEPRIMMVDPARITRLPKHQFQRWEDRGKVLSGDWDRELKEFEDLEVFRSLCAHFRDGVAWNETKFYEMKVNEVESGNVKWGCKSREDLDERFRGLDALFVDIRDNGFKNQEETTDKADSPYKLYDEVSVCIGRDGEMLFDDGRHRLSISKILGLTEIPVQVTVRHQEWSDFRNDIMAYASHNDGKVYAPLLHPDLSHIPSAHGHERFEMILENLPVKSGNVLDIGSHWGYFSHRFEEAGFTPFAVEANEGFLPFIEKLKKANNRQFEIVKKSIFDFRGKSDFAVVLGLNIFHHFLKTEELYNQLLELLGRLNMEVMYLGTHHAGEGQMVGSFRNLEPTEFVDFIIEHSCLTQSKLIGKSKDGRDLYLLTK